MKMKNYNNNSQYIFAKIAVLSNTSSKEQPTMVLKHAGKNWGNCYFNNFSGLNQIILLKNETVILEEPYCNKT